MELVVYDDDIKKTGEYLAEQYKAFRESIDTYTSILNDVSEEGIKEGKTKEALVEFIDQVYTSSEVKSSSAQSLGGKYKGYCTNYIDALDEVDGNLY